MATWVETGFLTFAEANKAKNQLLEDHPLPDDEEYDIDCYTTKHGQMYGITIVERYVPGPTEAEIAVSRAEYLEDR
jgi:hypothetical protein